LPAPGLGQPCDASKPCSSALFCTDGVCCGVASCGAGSACGLPTSPGRCALVDGGACASDGQCGSGACVDGYCCESRCDGQCQACDVPGSLGQCKPIHGAPHGKRLACFAGAAACDATTCDGTDGSRCTARVGSDVVCRAASCAAGVRTEVAHCDGAGGCPAATQASCAPWGCDATGTACTTSCTTEAECAPGFLCEAGVCTSPKAQCSTDALSILDGQGRSASCRPYLCRDGACLTACKTSDDCAPGTMCDGNECVAAPPSGAGGADQGGCAVAGTGAGAGAGAGAGWIAIAAIVIAGRRRRRRGR
jgi:hypothetical protein